MIYWTNFNFDSLPDLEIKRGRGQTYYLNGDFAVDIEVTSFYYDGLKRAYPYVMTVNILGNIIYCRYLTELAEIYQRLKQRYRLTYRRRLIMFVHNLAYEFQFFRDICKFIDVFARTRLKPLKCLDANSCIEFRCSYTVSGLSLKVLAQNLKNANIAKLSGEEYNYNKIRHSETALTEIELKYCEHDVLILHYWIIAEIEKNDSNIAKIPLTRTGYVRRECREYIFSRCDRNIYHKMIMRCTPDTECFLCLHKAFSGGDTHGNYIHVRHTQKNVTGFDFSSSYPAVMVKCKYPRKFRKIEIYNKEMFDNLLNNKACLFKCSFEHIKAKRHHHTLSMSKCDTIDLRTKVIDNGRIVEGSYITTYFTDVDFKDFCNFYDFENMRVIEFYYSDYQYLPTPFIEYILELFKNKTELKGFKDVLHEALYMKSKEFINGLYGMCVTNIVNEIIEFDNEWIDPPNLSEEEEKEEITDILDDYRKNFSSFLLYQWGVWVTAYARHYLRETIAKIEDNSTEIDSFVYCDTDSIKILDAEHHMKIINEYNKQNEKDMIKAMEYHGLPLDAFKAKTLKGDIKVLGNWENDGNYKRFKTLGAKRYMYLNFDINKKIKKKTTGKLKLVKYGVKYYDARWNLTNAGLNKIKALPYILKQGGFCAFKKGLVVPSEYTGKSTHTYINDYYSIDLVDYMGKISHCEQTHYIHLESQSYELNIVKEFEEYLEGATVSGETYEHKRKCLRTGMLGLHSKFIM